MNPYDTLGVEPSSTPKEIKAAYRKKAKQHHPDTPTGDRKKFEDANRAQLILLDPVRRKKFDDTGTIDEQNPDNAQAMAVSLIVGWISAVVVQASANSQDPCNTNLLEECRGYLRQQLASLKSQKIPIERAAKLMRKIEKRLQTKKQNAILRRALDAQVEAANIPLAQIDDKIRLHNDALKLLDDYGFDVEKRAAPTSTLNAAWFIARSS